MSSPPPSLVLPTGFVFKDLYTVTGLERLHVCFLDFLQADNETLAQTLNTLSSSILPLLDKERSAFLIQLSMALEKFLITFFSINDATETLRQTLKRKSAIARCRHRFLQKYVADRYTRAQCLSFDSSALWSQLQNYGITNDLIYANQVLKALETPLHPQSASLLKVAAHYAAWALYTPQGQQQHQNSALFYLPQSQNFEHLLKPSPSVSEDSLPPLRPVPPSQTIGLREAHYCLFCHKIDKDSCSKGLKNKINNKGESERSDKTTEKLFQTNTLGNVLTGCPLKQKISEMNWLYADLKPLAALAMITLDNPLVAATGHRICNDCRKSCIFQQQEPVDIPRIETRILHDVLLLPWGFEIYSLLTRWNPLRFYQPIPQAPSDRRVLIVGQGPAGFTLAHHLMNAGHQVVAIDGLKIDPLPPDLEQEPLYDVQSLFNKDGDRSVRGFGGVAEYGITRRWDKNYLTLIRLLLVRRSLYGLCDSVRLGSQLEIADGFAAGFDHIALCTGAGSPKYVTLKNNFAPGVFFAADFLMALHLQDGYKPSFNMGLQSPVLVIGGGLTAIDAAVEARSLLRHHGADPANSTVTVAYRGAWMEAPAYRLNHEEVQEALNQGIILKENVRPLEVILDDQGRTMGLKVECNDQEIVLEAKTVLIAVGSHPHSQMSLGPWLMKDFIVNKDQDLNLDLNFNQRHLSIFGDLHPGYQGSVVKAMASATRGAQVIHRQLLKHPRSSNEDQQQITAKIQTFRKDLESHVVGFMPLATNIFEWVIHSPAAARAYQPGQFFRLQRYETSGTKRLMAASKPLALTGLRVDQSQGLLYFIIFQKSKTSAQALLSRPGEKISVMGPTGMPSDLPSGQNVLLIGNDTGLAALLSQALALKERQNRLFLIMAYPDPSTVFHQLLFESLAERILWCWSLGIPSADVFTIRPQDHSLTGDLLNGLNFFQQHSPPSLSQILLMASPDQLQRLKQARDTTHRSLFAVCERPALCSVSAPMQCMMKGICGRCLQRQWDPETQQETFIFSCIQQEQFFDEVDVNFLSQRQLSASTLFS